MPFEKKVKNEKHGDISGLKYHKQLLKAIIRDTTLSANRRLLAEMVLMWLSASGRKQEVIESILLGTNFSRFIDGRGINAIDREDNGKETITGTDDGTSVLNAISMIERGNAAV